MTATASLSLEHLLPSPRKRTQAVRIWRGLQGVKKQRERVQLLITIAVQRVRSRIPAAIERRGRTEITIMCEVAGALIDSGVAHQVLDSTVKLESGTVQILAITDPDQIRYLNRVQKGSSVTRYHTWRITSKALAISLADKSPMLETGLFFIHGAPYSPNVPPRTNSGSAGKSRRVWAQA